MSQLPAGTIISYVGQDLTSLPPNWLYCDGSSLSASQYQSLYDAIGTAFGSSNGGYFNLPALQGMFLRGVDDGAGVDPDSASRQAQSGNGSEGGNTGDAVGSVQQFAMENHTHTLGPASGFYSSGDYGVCLNAPGNGGTTGTSGDSTETRPVNLYVYYLIYCGD